MIALVDAIDVLVVAIYSDSYIKHNLIAMFIISDYYLTYLIYLAMFKHNLIASYI